MRNSPCCDARGTSRIIFSGGKDTEATLPDVLHLYDSNSTQLVELKPLYVLFLSIEKIYVNLYIVLILWDSFFLVYYKIKRF